MTQKEMIKTRRVTIKDVAEYCGLSKSTVAYIISNSEYRKGSEQNRKLVEKAVKALAYRPNHAARSLSSRRGFTIGVTMPISGSGFYGEMVLQLQQMIKTFGYYSMFAFWGGADPRATREDAFRTMIERNVDGILSWELPPPVQYENIPAVIYGRDSDSYDNVSPDYQKLARDVLTHLTELGHRKIGFIGIQDDARFAYLKQQAPDFNVDIDPVRCVLFPHVPVPENVLEILLKQCGGDLPTAVFVQFDSMAIPVIKIAAGMGLRVPEDLSVISCDNIEMAKFYSPGLTTFDTNRKEIANAMVSQLLERMTRPESPLKSIKIRPQLIVRESCMEMNAKNSRKRIEE